MRQVVAPAARHHSPGSPRISPAGSRSTWSEPGNPTRYKLGRIDATGAFLEGPYDVSAVVKWGRRDDPFRRHANGDVVWAWFDAASSTTLRLGRVRSGAPSACTPLP